MKTLEDLSLGIMFGTTKTEKDLEGAGWVFRKGKSIADINHALKKAQKNGRGKFEYEHNMFEIYLADVLKRKRA